MPTRWNGWGEVLCKELTCITPFGWGWAVQSNPMSHPLGLGGGALGWGRGRWTKYSDVPPLRDGWGDGQGTQMYHHSEMVGGMDKAVK